MLEKIGLPAKPSMRGSNWVVDASHCQGCSSQFSFINRKHHCRRCGGIFCGSCTSQRMVLRGQGDSPVRICEPCKKLEEAARFELRHGYKNRTSRGGSKLNANHEDEVLNQILATDIKQPSTSTNASSSRFNEEATSPSAETQNGAPKDIGSYSPEELIQLSLEEKKKYKILKGQGKPDEALRAFKRGKDFERQAKALEVAQRKNNRKTLSSNSLGSKMNGEPEGVITKSKLSSHVDKEEKKDLASELRELGWSDADLHDANKKPIQTSLEGELSTLLGEVHKNPVTDKTQVIALKKKAVMYKKEGNLAAAKEELKKAKILEKQLEEEEFSIDDEDSEDEISSMIRSMGDDKQDDFTLLDKQDAGFDFNHLMGVSDDLGLDGNFDVTEDDLEDPEMAAALESLGWTEELEQPMDEALSLKREAVKQKQSGNIEEAKPKLKPQNKLTIQRELLAIKKRVLGLKREGRVEEAEAESRKAKVLECQLQDMESAKVNTNSKISEDDEADVTEQDMQDPAMLEMLRTMGWKGEDIHHENVLDTAVVKGPKRSKAEIQRELLGLKRKALSLRRQGAIEEAEEVSKKAKLLEDQIKEIEVSTHQEGPSVKPSPKIPLEEKRLSPEHAALATSHRIEDSAPLLVVEHEEVKIADGAEKATFDSQSDLSQEILTRKKKAVALKREGKLVEAREELRQAKILEKSVVQEENKPQERETVEKSVVQEENKPQERETVEPGPKPMSDRERFKLQQESLGHKRQALKLRREGRMAEAEAESELAKAIESRLEESAASDSTKKADGKDDLGVEGVLDPQLVSALKAIGLQGDEVVPNLSQERTQLEQRIKAEKVRALNLKQAGKQAEALEALRRAKMYEKQLSTLA